MHVIIVKKKKDLGGGRTRKELQPLQGTERDAWGTGMEEHYYGAGISMYSMHIYLKITFASLITNGAIQWVIGQQELHHSLSSI